MHSFSSKRIKHWLFASLLFHLVIMGVLFLFPKVPQPVQKKVVIEVEPVTILEEKIEKAEQSRKSERPAIALKSTSKNLHLSDLAQLKDSTRDGRSAGAVNSLEVVSRPKGNGFEVAEKMDINTEAKLYPFFHGLWKKIDAALGYPVDFAKARIEGSVQLQFEVDAKGVMTGQVLQLDSQSKHLKAYVLAILVHALQSPLPQQNWSPLGKAMVVAQFDFEIFTTGSNREPQKSSHIKNVLTFKRASYVTPKLNDLIEKFYERFIPPVFPIPGGFYIDFPRAYRMIESIGTPDPDEMRDERIQLKLEEWSRVVKEKQ